MSFVHPSRRALVGGALAVALAPTGGWGETLGEGGLRLGAPRVASLDDAITETLVALGHPPVAAPDTPSWSRWVVEPPLPPEVTNIGAEQEVDLEALAALRPDLILVTPYVDGDLVALERIAPCRRIAINGPDPRPPLERAVAAAREIAGLVGASERGEALVAEAEAAFSRDGSRLAGRRLPPLLLASLLDGRHMRVYGANSLWHDVLGRLGRADAWTGPTDGWGFSTVGVEALARAPDAALVVVDPVPPDALATLDRSPLWRALPAVRAGRVLRLPVAAAFGGLPAAMRFSRLLTDALIEARLG